MINRLLHTYRVLQVAFKCDQCQFELESGGAAVQSVAGMDGVTRARSFLESPVSPVSPVILSSGPPELCSLGEMLLVSTYSNFVIPTSCGVFSAV